MTLDQCYAANEGKALLIPGGGAGNEGQCVQWADTVLHDVYGFDYHWGNAIDWWNSPGELLNHFDQITDGSIRKGDIVVFNSQVGSVYGHIDVAMSDGTTANFQGADSNWGGNKTVHLVQHTNPAYVLGSFRLKGGTMPASQDKVDDTTVRLEYNNGLLRNASADEVNAWVSQGVTVEQFQRAVQTSAEHLGIQQAVIDNAAKDKVIADLKAQLAKQPTGGLDAATKAEIDNTNSIVQWVKDKLNSVFK